MNPKRNGHHITTSNMLLLDVQVLNKVFNFEPYTFFTKNVQKKMNLNIRYRGLKVSFLVWSADFKSLEVLK